MLIEKGTKSTPVQVVVVGERQGRRQNFLCEVILHFFYGVAALLVLAFLGERGEG